MDSDQSLYDDDDGDFSESEIKGYLVEDVDKDIESSLTESNYFVLEDSDIKERLEDDIRRVSTVLSLSRDASCILLRHFNWSVSKVHEAWFSDEDGVKKAIGLLDDPVVQFPKAKTLKCGICFDTFRTRETKSAACGHPYCRECWAGYIGTSISDGPGCLSLRCPDPSCTAFVGQEMINYLASREDKQKYENYLYRSYIEDNKKTKWCPAPGCEYAVNFTGDSENYDVYCSCTNGFCWNCTDDAHRPVDCETVAKWALKNKSESENVNWLLANSKPCPKCRRPIEKNLGCMHMTCTAPCRHSFCWLCLDDWSTHRSYACNGYKDVNKADALSMANKKRGKARRLLGRYTHHYERWASNESSMKKSIKDLEEMKTVKIAKLGEIQAQTETQLMFIIDAWKQIIHCRRVLKWTYAYGYYLSEDEQGKRLLFEFLQGQAEAGLERLHQAAEEELEYFLQATEPSVKFCSFREKLLRLTRVTKTYFENLVKAMENGLVDVNTSSTSNTGAEISDSVINTYDWSNWSCSGCTFLNDSSSTYCEACNLPR